MAEAVVNAWQAEDWEAHSAGTFPEQQVNPYALAALKEIGVEHEGRAKHVDDFAGWDFDLVVTVCDDAAENCPLWLGKGAKVHQPFPDPAKARGSEEELAVIYRDVLAQIRREIPPLLEGFAGWFSQPAR